MQTALYALVVLTSISLRSLFLHITISFWVSSPFASFSSPLKLCFYLSLDIFAIYAIYRFRTCAMFSFLHNFSISLISSIPPYIPLWIFRSQYIDKLNFFQSDNRNISRTAHIYTRLAPPLEVRWRKIKFLNLTNSLTTVPNDPSPPSVNHLCRRQSAKFDGLNRASADGSRSGGEFVARARPPRIPETAFSPPSVTFPCFCFSVFSPTSRVWMKGRRTRYKL